MVILLSLASCSQKDKYAKPATPDIKAWSSNADNRIQTGKADGKWWLPLNDKVLEEIIRNAIKNNQDLKIIEARVAEAEAVSGKVKSTLLPDINILGSSRHEGGQDSRGGLADANTLSEVGVNAVWDLDVFGSKRSELKASKANLMATKASYQLALQALLKEIVATYIDLRTQQQLLALTEQNLKIQNDTYRATKIQFDAKAASKLDLLRSEAQVKDTQSQIPSIRASIAAKIYHIAVLTGNFPGSADQALKKEAPIPEFSNMMMLATPVDSITARPDIQIAAFRLDEQAHLKNARAADIFPKISLSGFFGIGTATLYPNSTPWSAGANALVPLLNFGRITREIEAAGARKQQAYYRYRKTVLEAVEQTENALTVYIEESQRTISLQQSVDAQKEAAKLARIKYEAGDAAFIDVLVAEEKLLDIESRYLQSRAAVSRSVVDVYTALGILAPVDDV